MGYQESYIRAKNEEVFDELVVQIKSNGEDKFILANPVEIITLLKPITINIPVSVFGFQFNRPLDLDLGEQFIYVVGERSAQYSVYNIFNECTIPGRILRKLEIYPTEIFPSEDLFCPSNKIPLAHHQEFTWN